MGYNEFETWFSILGMVVRENVGTYMFSIYENMISVMMKMLGKTIICLVGGKIIVKVTWYSIP